MIQPASNSWLRRFAAFTAVMTLFLIGIGGLVTSHGAGMAVPDWPTSYGYNMFLFPPSYWIGGIFYEHTHRLFASFVGFLTTILAVWLWLKEPRLWMRWLGTFAFVAVVLQGVLGGLRVTLYKDEIGIVHAALAQIFLVTVSLIAFFTSKRWVEWNEGGERASKSVVCILAGTTALIFAQLVLGATMRHQHAGLAVPDFPLAYGRAWPPLDDASIELFNRQRVDSRDFNPITGFQIVLHMTHRMVALCIVAGACGCAWLLKRRLGRTSAWFRVALAWLGLIWAQAALGAATVLTNKAADVATLHVVFGAASLVIGALLLTGMVRLSLFAPQAAAAARDRAESISSQKFAPA